MVKQITNSALFCRAQRFNGFVTATVLCNNENHNILEFRVLINGESCKVAYKEQVVVSKDIRSNEKTGDTIIKLKVSLQQVSGHVSKTRNIITFDTFVIISKKNVAIKFGDTFNIHSSNFDETGDILTNDLIIEDKIDKRIFSICSKHNAIVTTKYRVYSFFDNTEDHKTKYVISDLSQFEVKFMGKVYTPKKCERIFNKDKEVKHDRILRYEIPIRNIAMDTIKVAGHMYVTTSPDHNIEKTLTFTYMISDGDKCEVKPIDMNISHTVKTEGCVIPDLC